MSDPDQPAARPTNSITILTSSDERGQPNGFWTKRVTKKGATEVKFPFLNTSQAVETNSIFDLGSHLDQLADKPHSCIISGALRSDAPAVHQRCYRPSKTVPEPAYEAQLRQWLCLDVDKLAYDLIGCSPETLPQVLSRRIVQQCLPTVFHNVTYYWQLSSSHGYGKAKVKVAAVAEAPAVSVHLWFWLNRPCSDEELKRYNRQLNYAARIKLNLISDKKVFDDLLFNPVQPHFTADPILDPDIEPLPYARRGLDCFDQHVVVITTELDLGEGAWKRWLEQIGKDGFCDPILKTIGSYVHEHGRAALQDGPRTTLKEAIQRQIDLADPGDRNPDKIARYRSDEWLDRAFEGAVDKGYGQAGADQGAEAAGQEFVYCRYTDDFFHKERRYPTKASGVSRSRRSNKDVTKNKFFLENIQHVDLVRAVPGCKDQLVMDEGIEVWSCWSGRMLEPTYGDASWFVQHITYLCDDDERVAGALLDWIAHLLAKPGERIMWAPILGSSKEGIGKSLVGGLLGRLIKGTHFITDNDVKEKFKDYTINNELAVCEEVRIDAKLNAADQLKVYITEPRVNIRRFGKPHEMIRNYCHHWFNTNYRDAMPLHQEGDRRYLPIFTDREPMSQEYYTKIWQHVNEDASDVLGWALQRDLSRFNPFAAPPQTEAGRQMAELARPVDEQLIVEAIKERAFPFDFKVWFSSEVLHRLGRALQVRPPGPQALRQLVERHGGAYLRINCMDENGQRTKRAVFIFDDVQENLGSLSEKELDAMAQAESKRRLDRARERREQDEAGIEVAKKAALRLVKDIG